MAEACDRARRLADAGLRTEGLRIDWPALMVFKRSFTEPVPERRAEEYARAGIDALRGVARFAGPNAIEVEGVGRLEARHVLIATGAEPARLPIAGTGLLRTSDDFLELDRLPESILFVGGGYVVAELAHIAARAGARATILHQDERPLAHFDRDLVGRLVERSRRLGIGVELGAEVEALEPRADGIAARASDGRTFGAAVAVHGSGRVPNIDGLDLAAGRVEAEEGRLRLYCHLRSVSNPAVWAAGDAAAAGPPLTPVASHDAACVAANLLEGCRHEPDYRGVASVVFTIPPLATVGFTEERAREEGPGHRGAPGRTWPTTSRCVGRARPRPRSRCSWSGAAAASWARTCSGRRRRRSSTCSRSRSSARAAGVGAGPAPVRLPLGRVRDRRHAGVQGTARAERVAGPGAA